MAEELVNPNEEQLKELVQFYKDCKSINIGIRYERVPSGKENDPELTWYYMVYATYHGIKYVFAIHYHPFHKPTDQNWIHAKRSANEDPDIKVNIPIGNGWFIELCHQSANFRNMEGTNC